MFNYLVRRVAIGLLTLLLITFVVYALDPQHARHAADGRSRR